MRVVAGLVRQTPGAGAIRLDGVQLVVALKETSERNAVPLRRPRGKVIVTRIRSKGTDLSGRDGDDKESLASLPEAR